MRKGTVDIEILITTRKGGIKIMQPIRITSGPVKRMMKRNQFSQIRLTLTKVIAIEKT